MTKRLSLWNQQLSSTSHGSEESKDSPRTIRAKFFMDNPHLIKTPEMQPPAKEPDTEPEPEAQDDGPLEAGSWEKQEALEALPREELPDRRRGKRARRVPKHKTRRPTHMTTTGSCADSNSHVQTLSNVSGHVNPMRPWSAAPPLGLWP
jgi:hypothetical protein